MLNYGLGLGREEITIPQLRAMVHQEQDEPFFTPECTLNDQYAEIEQVRQDIINNPNQKTIDAMHEAEGILNKKHSHYRKSVKHLDFIDPYRIAQLYDLHPCADHIAKKALCTGKRGHKDLMRDIQDIIDTAERWKQMIQEDQNAI